MDEYKKHFTPAEILELKNISIVNYLVDSGFEIEKIRGGETVFISPNSNEKNGSFMVNPKKNVFFDNSNNKSNTGEYGDIITLVRNLENCSFIDACNHLLFNNYSAIIQPLASNNEVEIKTGNKVLSSTSLRSYALLTYLEKRRIRFSLADKYLKEVHYQNSKGNFYALGFQNNLGGYELRSEHFKGATKPKTYTTIRGTVTSNTINVFEGFFSYLSALEYNKVEQLQNWTIVLNSVSNLSKFLAEQQAEGQFIKSEDLIINSFLDNDTGGKTALEKMIRLGFYVKDYSSIYKGYKDFNELLLSK